MLSLFGVALAVGLVTSASFFSQAVDTVILRREMSEYSRVTGRPPFSSRVFTTSTDSVPLSLTVAETLGDDTSDTLSSEVGLPIKSIGMQIDSGVMKLQPRPEAPRYNPDMSAQNVNLLYIKNVAEQMEILEGKSLDETPTDVLEVWVHSYLVDKMGLQIGDGFNLTAGRDTEPFTPLRIAGFWQPTDPENAFWTSDPNQTLRDKLLVRRNDYQTHVEPLLNIKVRSVNWQIVLDEQAVLPAYAREYISGFERGAVIIGRYLPEARVTTPTLSLGKFVDRQTTLTTLLLGFNIPALGFLLYFLVLTSVVIAYWQQRELLILVSRGMSRLDVVTFTLVDGLLLFLIGLPVGLGLGIILARLMGYTVSFLSFGLREPLPVSWHGFNLPLVLMTLGIILLAKLWSVISLNRQQLMDRNREHTRSSRAPFWYRAWLDMLLIIPAWYGYQQLLRRGSLALLVEDRPEELYRDPLLILVPALLVLSFSLISMRVFALTMRLIDWLAGLAPNISLHLALRQLGRYSHTYINPLLLVTVSLALGIYTMSMAASLDQWLEDRMYHRAGADISFEPFLESSIYEEVTERSIGADWIPLPDEFESLPGVEAAARVGDYRAEVEVATNGGRNLRARFLAIDRTDFDKVAWFRPDFAPESLGGLMNRLAVSSENILVSQKFLEQNSLRVGDQVRINVYPDFSAGVESLFTIAGIYQYFPTVYDDEMTIVGNLDYIFLFFGMIMPHDIWLQTEEGLVDGQTILDEAVPETGILTIREKDAKRLINEEQAKMERVGVFGTLSVSFIMAAVMAALGLLTYSYASLQERRHQFAVLRAAGMSYRQALTQIGLEYGILICFGAMAGIVAGSIAAYLCVPLFRVTGEGGMPLPPLLPVIAQSEVLPLALIFATLMIIAELIIVGAELYRRLFDSLRMGFG